MAITSKIFKPAYWLPKTLKKAPKIAISKSRGICSSLSGCQLIDSLSASVGKISLSKLFDWKNYLKNWHSFQNPSTKSGSNRIIQFVWLQIKYIRKCQLLLNNVKKWNCLVNFGQFYLSLWVLDIKKYCK